MREGERYIFKKDDNSNRYDGLVGDSCKYLGRPKFQIGLYGCHEFRMDCGQIIAVDDSAEFELLEGKA